MQFLMIVMIYMLHVKFYRMLYMKYHYVQIHQDVVICFQQNDMFMSWHSIYRKDLYTTVRPQKSKVLHNIVVMAFFMKKILPVFPFPIHAVVFAKISNMNEIVDLLRGCR